MFIMESSQEPNLSNTDAQELLTGVTIKQIEKGVVERDLTAMLKRYLEDDYERLIMRYANC